MTVEINPNQKPPLQGTHFDMLTDPDTPENKRKIRLRERNWKHVAMYYFLEAPLVFVSALPAIIRSRRAHKKPSLATSIEMETTK